MTSYKARSRAAGGAMPGLPWACGWLVHVHMHNKQSLPKSGDQPCHPLSFQGWHRSRGSRSSALCRMQQRVGTKMPAPCRGGGGRTAGTQYMSVYLQCPNNIHYHVQCRYSVDWCLLKCTIMDCTVVFLSLIWQNTFFQMYTRITALYPSQIVNNYLMAQMIFILLGRSPDFADTSMSLQCLHHGRSICENVVPWKFGARGFIL